MPQDNDYEKKLELSIVRDSGDVDFIMDRIEEIFKDEKSIGQFQNADYDHVREFFHKIADKKVDTDWCLCAFRDTKDKHIVGAVLFSFGSPWYNPNVRAICEELTVSFEKGYGIARAVASYMAYYVYMGYASVATGAAAQEYCQKEIANSYKKFDYHSYPSFYLTKEDIQKTVDAKKETDN